MKLEDGFKYNDLENTFKIKKVLTTEEENKLKNAVERMGFRSCLFLKLRKEGYNNSKD